MDNIKGIVFSLESLIKSSKKKLLSNTILIDQDEINQIIQKLNKAILDHEKIATNPQSDHYSEPITEDDTIPNEPGTIDAKKLAFKIKQDANDYADGILSRLQLLTTKLQSTVIRIESNISEGRKLLVKHQMDNKKGDYNEE